tara:strand:- start:372 stop:728 length:357 start_codon:yes stop_codon:yes gene_type:complete
MLINYILGGIVLNYLFSKKQKGGSTRNKTVTLNGEEYNKTVTLNGEEYDVDKILDYFENKHPGGKSNIKKIRSTIIDKNTENYDSDNTLLHIWEKTGVKWHGENKRVLKVLENLESKN